MIIGIGNDLVDMRRIEKIIERFEERFTHKHFTDIERKLANNRRAGGGHIAAYARRFAAKEAVAKALGTGFRGGIEMHHIGVVTNNYNAPEIILTAAAKDRLLTITPKGMQARIHISLSDEPPYAQAFAIIEALTI